MKQVIYDFFIGGFIALFASLLIKSVNNNYEPLNIFAFLWAAPILLFLPIYIYYKEGEIYVKNFLLHAFIGCILTIFCILITYLLLKINILFAIIVNLGLSYLFIYLYFKLKLYKIIMK